MEIVKKGAVFTSKEPVNISVKCKVAEKMYTKNNKKYIDLELPLNVSKQISELHKKFNEHMTKSNISNPLEGNTLKVKIPFLKNRVTCKIEGDKTIQEYKKGENFTGTINFCGIWSIGDYCGPSWKLVSVQ